MSRSLPGAVLLLALAAAGCREPREPVRAPLLLIGIDGGELSVVDAMWKRGELPNLKRLAERGSFGQLRTFSSKSPVIWTTIATGVDPGAHGVVDFIVPHQEGQTPVTSGVRRRPALWEMLGRVDRRTAVLGWWVTWPAETLDGLMVSDRAARGLAGSIWPPSRQADLDRWLAAADKLDLQFGTDRQTELQDRLTLLAAREAAADGYDLLMAYFRSTDIASHRHFREFVRWAETGPAPESDGGPVATAYRATDTALGEILAAAPRDARVLVVSDHGFEQRPTSRYVYLNLSRALAQLGLVKFAADGLVDPAASLLWTDDLLGYQHRKQIFLRSGLAEAEQEQALATLRAALPRFTFGTGAPAFRFLTPKSDEFARGARAVVEVDPTGIDGVLRLDGSPIPGVVQDAHELSGDHGSRTHGMFFAAGPGFARGAKLSDAGVQSIAPTVLFALGLPVAKDFVRGPLLELFDPAFRAAYPVREIDSWGVRAPQQVESSAADSELIRELGGLGYLN